MVSVHEIAQSGFGSGTNELYDRARPSYQAPAISFIRDAVRSPAPLNVVEIGVGTGIFTRALLQHPAWTQDLSELRAIEPSEGMLEVFQKTVKDARVSSNQGTFDTTGVQDGWADVVIVAQAFHWCPDYDAASKEFARILKPNGIVSFIWNLEDRDGAKWVAGLRDRVERHEAGTPQFRLGLWRQTFDTPSYQALFEPPQEETWAYTLEGSLEIAVNRACSKSYIAVLPKDEKASVVSDIEKVIQADGDKKWIDKEAGTFEYPYKTYVVVAKKK